MRQGGSRLASSGAANEALTALEEALQAERELKQVLIRPPEGNQHPPFGRYCLGQLLVLAGRDPKVQLERRDRLEDACDLWLYRHDDKISPKLYSKSMEILTAFFRESLGVGKLLMALAALYSVYFDANWRSRDVFLDANRPRISDIRDRYGKSSLNSSMYKSEAVATMSEPQSQDVRQLTALSFDNFVQNPDDTRPVVVMFLAHYCSHCRAMTPEFAMASKKMRDCALFGSVNGPENFQIVVKQAIQRYPTIRLYLNGEWLSELDISRSTSSKEIVSFVDSCGELNGYRPRGRFMRRPDLGYQPVESAFEVLKEHGIDETDEMALERERSIQQRISSELRKSGVDIESVQEDQTVCSLDNLQSCVNPSEQRRPTIIFMGGGMASGKTAVRKLLETTQFWKERGDRVVIVEADAFKHIDPVYQVLSSVTNSASRMVHSASTRAAEELLVKAVAARRDILFDSSMSWAPFISQTVDMVRDTDNLYRRGPGEVTNHEGKVVEEYWERVGPSNHAEPPPEYHLELVGVTVPPEIAVCRGLIRMLQTGRGVPISSQLESHRLFSSSFDNYTRVGEDKRGMFDGITLLDNSGEEPSDPLSKPTGGLKPTVVAARGDFLASGCSTEKLEIFDRDKFDSFLAKKNLNSNADNSSELFNAYSVN